MTDLLSIDPGDPAGYAYFVDGEYDRSGEVKTTKKARNRLGALSLLLLSEGGGSGLWCVDYLVCERLFIAKKGKANPQTIITLGERRGALLAGVFPAAMLIEPWPVQWMRGRKALQIRREAEMVAGREVGEHEGDAILAGVWALGKIKMLEAAEAAERAEGK